MDRPVQFARKRSHRAPHPRSPAARTFDWCSAGLPHPDSPALRYIDWASSLFPHPSGPSSREYHWATARDGGDASADEELARTSQAVETCLDRYSDKLRDALPDFNLQVTYDRRISLLKETYAITRSPTVVDPIHLLKNVQAQIEWVHCHLRGTLPKSYEAAVRPILDEVHALEGEVTGGDKGKRFTSIQFSAERFYQAAIEGVRKQWAETQKTGKQAELIRGWRTRMLQCSSSGAVVGAPIEELAAPPKRPKKDSAADETAVKTWIAIQLVDEVGHPVPNAGYKVTLPDGSIMTGSLDDQGLARFDEIDPGDCKITFPEIDAREWK